MSKKLNDLKYSNISYAHSPLLHNFQQNTENVNFFRTDFKT